MSKQQPQKITLKTMCPRCKSPLSVEVDSNDVTQIPKLRSKHQPISNVLIYKETTETIKQFLTDKIRSYAPDVSIELLTRYSERKHRDDDEPHRSYAYFILAMTANEVLTAESDDLYIRLGSEGRDNLSFVSEIKNHVINKYRVDKQWLIDTTRSYKKMEKLEVSLGLNQNMISEMLKFSNPSIIKSNGTAWVELAISAEKVLDDMFYDRTTNQTLNYKINDIKPISDNNVQYDIRVDVAAKKTVAPDSSVTQLIRNSIKNK
jgi:hypothetical protein